MGGGAAPLRTLPLGGTPPSCTPPCVRFSAGGAPKKFGFFSPKSVLRIWWFSHLWTLSWENCAFSSKWNRLWRLKASFAIKGLSVIFGDQYRLSSHSLVSLTKNVSDVLDSHLDPLSTVFSYSLHMHYPLHVVSDSATITITTDSCNTVMIWIVSR